MYAKLADYEKLGHQVVVDDAALREHLFGPRPSAEALLGFAGDEAYESLGATVLPDWRVCRVTGEALEQLGK